MTGLMSGTLSQQVSASTLAASSISGVKNSNFAYSIWYYIDDWNYRSTSNKILFGRSSALAAGSDPINNTSGQNPVVAFDANANDLTIYMSVTTFGKSGDPPSRAYPEDTKCAGGVAGRTASCCTKSDYQHAKGMSAYTAGNPWKGDVITSAFNAATTAWAPNATDYGNGCDSAGTYKSDNTDSSATNYKWGACSDGTARSDKFGTNCPEFTTGQQCKVTNVPIQKWTNITISVFGTSLDVYMDGKLVKTCILDGIPNNTATEDVFITPLGGFSGWTSKFAYYPNPVNPQQAWDIYQAGYGASWLSNLFGQYSMQVSFLQNGTESSSFTI